MNFHVPHGDGNSHPDVAVCSRSGFVNFSLCEFTTVPLQGDMNFHAPYVDGNSHPMWPYVLVRNFHRRTQKCEFCVFSPTSVVLFETRVTLGCNLQRDFRIKKYQCFRSTRICEFIEYEYIPYFNVEQNERDGSVGNLERDGSVGNLI